MPYISPAFRDALAKGEPPETPGDLNYLICQLVDRYLNAWDGGPGYAAYNEVVGVLECAKLEVYRRLVAPYEEGKMVSNGDVFGRG